MRGYPTKEIFISVPCNGHRATLRILTYLLCEIVYFFLAGCFEIAFVFPLSKKYAFIFCIRNENLNICCWTIKVRLMIGYLKNTKNMLLAFCVLFAFSKVRTFAQLPCKAEGFLFLGRNFWKRKTNRFGRILRGFKSYH